jgi:hypothetical protein
VLLTAAQSLFGVAVLASLSLSLLEAGLLGSIFIAQLVVGGFIRAGLHSPEAAAAELLWFTIVYILLSVLFLFQARGTITHMFQRPATLTMDRPPYV